MIDEISMVSAKLLAQMDVKLRSVVREIGTAKVGSNKHDRPFGGLNVLFCGDFWQLDPPDGGFLGNIPVEFIQAARRHLPAPTVAHGQSPLWGGAEHGTQGVTELEDHSIIIVPIDVFCVVSFVLRSACNGRLFAIGILCDVSVFDVLFVVAYICFPS